jgi:phosphoglucomutase
VPEGQLVSVESILKKFWSEFGRNYYSRYDFENIDTEKGNQVWKHLEEQVKKYVMSG